MNNSKIIHTENIYTTMLLLFDASIHQNMHVAEEVQRGEDWEEKLKTEGWIFLLQGTKKKRLVTSEQGGYMLGLSHSYFPLISRLPLADLCSVSLEINPGEGLQ